MYLSTELYSLTWFFLYALDTWMFFDVAQQSFDVLFEHRDGTFTKLEGSIVLLELWEDGTVLKFEFDEDSGQFKEGFFFWWFEDDFLELLFDPFTEFITFWQLSGVVVATGQISKDH